MAKEINSIQFKRAASKTTNVNNTILQDGEPAYIRDTNELYIGYDNKKISELIPIVNKTSNHNAIASNNTQLPTGGAVYSALQLNTINNIENSTKWPTAAAVKTYVDAAIISSAVLPTSTVPTSGFNNYVTTVAAIRAMSTSTVTTDDTFYFTNGSAIKKYVDTRFANNTGNLGNAAFLSTTNTVSSSYDTYLPKSSAVRAYADAKITTTWASNNDTQAPTCKTIHNHLGTAATRNTIYDYTLMNNSSYSNYIPTCAAVSDYVQSRHSVLTKTQDNLTPNAEATGSFTRIGGKWDYHTINCIPQTNLGLGIINITNIDVSNNLTTVGYRIKNIGNAPSAFTIKLLVMK